MEKNTIKERTARKKLTYKRNQYLFACTLLIFPIVLFLIFFVYGRFYSIFIAFSEVDFLGNATFLGLDRLFENFERFFSQIESGALLGTSLLNSLKAWLIAFLISNPLYYIFSYFIYKKTKGAGFFQIMTMLPQMISSLIFALVFKQIVNGPLIEIMNVLGQKDFPNLLSDSTYAFELVMFYNIWVSFGISVVFYANAMTGVSPEIIESAQLDGVWNMFQELFYILIPLTFPTFKTLLVIGLTTIFTTDYGLMNFYMYGAPSEIWNMGYYIVVKTYNSSSTGYPVLAVSGILLSLISLPIVLGIKKLTDKIDPISD